MLSGWASNAILVSNGAEINGWARILSGAVADSLGLLRGPWENLLVLLELSHADSAPEFITGVDCGSKVLVSLVESADFVAVRVLLIEEADAVLAIVDSGCASILAVSDGIVVVDGSIDSGSSSETESKSDLSVLWSILSEVLAVVAGVLEGWRARS